MIPMTLRLRTAPSFALVAVVLAASCQGSGSGGGADAGVAGSAGSGETTGRGGSSAAGASGTSGVAGAAGSAPGGVSGGSGAAGGNTNGGTGGDDSGRGGTGGSSGGASGGGQRGGAGGGANGGVGGGGRGGSTGGVSGGSGGSAVGGTGGTTPTQATYYVSPSGSDANPGSMSAPFLTVTKARDVVRTVNASMTADIVVYLRGGNYPVASTIAFGPSDSGTNGHRIIYQAYPGETPVLNGATKVTGWTVSSGSVYKAALARSTKLRNLYVNDARASMTSKTVTSQGGTGTYSVTSGQASWAWASGSNSDGAKYKTDGRACHRLNKDDLEIVNGTTWNENIVCVRDVVTTSDNYRGLLFQQPYGAIAQLPSWNAGFSVSGTHTIYNALELLNGPGQFYFDKTAGTLYYYPRAGEDMATADVEAPVVETLIAVAGTSNASRVKNLTFQGITFANTDYGLYTRRRLARQGDRPGRRPCSSPTATATGTTASTRSPTRLPGMITVNSADAISFVGNVHQAQRQRGDLD